MQVENNQFTYTCRKCKSGLRIDEKEFIEIKCPSCQEQVGIHSVESIKEI